MADAMAAGTAPERVPETEVLVGEIDSTMSDLMLAARQAENLRPLTEEEADAMTVAQLGDRAALIFSHFKFALMSERDFILRFRVELNVLRRKTTQQGRRLPIPGCPTWGEVKKTYFKLSGRQIDALLADPKPDRKEPEPEPKEVGEITVRDDQPETPTPSDEAVEKIHEAANEPDQPLPVTDAEVARIHEAAAADTLPDTGDEVAAEREDPRTEPAPCSLNGVTVSVLANILNRAFAEKNGRHEAVREMLKLLDKCVLWEISYASSEERSNRLRSFDKSAQHVFPSEAAEEVLKRGGFWSAKALIGEADIHVTWDSVPNGCGVSLDHFKQHLLGYLRLTGKLKTRMLGRVYWYCHPDHEAALKAAKKPEGPEFHYAEDELRKGAAPQSPLVEPRAARHGQGRADDSKHPLSSLSGKEDAAPPASPAAAPTEDEPQPEAAMAGKPRGSYLPPIWMEDGRHGHVVVGLSSGAKNFQVRLTTGETVKVPKDGYVSMDGCENRAEVLGQDFMERRFMPEAWLNDANGAYDIATERVPPEALEFLRVLGDKPAA